MTIEATTLEELGWNPYWDSSGHNKVNPDDVFEITPSGTIDICYLSRPIQDEDGKWYGNSVFMYEPWPGLIAGMYKKERILNNATLGGVVGEFKTINGKIEEIAYWGKDIGISGLVNYQDNLSGMVGTGVGFKYQTAAEAEADLLYYYFSFDSPASVRQNFIANGTTSIKSEILEIGSGKHNNASILNGDDSFINIEKIKSEKEISMNIRFYMESLDDFVLYDSQNVISISFDEVTGKFAVTIFPYIGNKKTVYIEIRDIKVHHWYDFGVLYNLGLLTVVVDGHKIEENLINVGLGGVEKISLHMANVASISIAGFTHGIYTSIWSDGVHMEHEADPSSALYGKVNHLDTFDTGAGHAIDLLCDRAENRGATTSAAYGGNLAATSVAVLDPVSDRRKVAFSNYFQIGGSRNYCYSNGYMHSDLSIEDIDGDQFKIERKIYSSGSFCSGPWFNKSTMNKLFGMNVIRVRIKFKPELIDTEDVFPMLTTFPGTRLKVTRAELTPDIEYVNLIKSKGKWGRFWKNVSSTHPSYLTTYPAFHNTTGKTLIVKIPNSSEYAYVWNNYVCYFNGSLVVTTYHANDRHVYPDNNKVWDINILALQA